MNKKVCCMCNICIALMTSLLPLPSSLQKLPDVSKQGASLLQELFYLLMLIAILLLLPIIRLHNLLIRHHNLIQVGTQSSITFSLSLLNVFLGCNVLLPKAWTFSVEFHLIITNIYGPSIYADDSERCGNFIEYVVNPQIVNFPKQWWNFLRMTSESIVFPGNRAEIG